MGRAAFPVGIYRQEVVKVMRKRFRVTVPACIAYLHFVDEPVIVGGKHLSGDVVHRETVHARRVVQREGDGRGERLPVEEEGSVLAL